MGLLQGLLNSAYLGLGNDIFIFIGLFSIILILGFRFGLPLPLQFIIGFLFTILVGGMEVSSLPVLPEIFRVMLVIVFGLILGMLTYFFFFRRG